MLEKDEIKYLLSGEESFIIVSEKFDKFITKQDKNLLKKYITY